MKEVLKWYAIAALVIAAAGAFGAAVTEVEYVTHDATYTVDAQKSGTWDLLDSIVVVASDTGALYMSVSGTAIMDPGDKLYLGFACHIKGVTTAAANLDTAIVTCPKNAVGKQYVPFVFERTFCDTTKAFQGFIGGCTDTVWFKAACGGSTTKEQVALENVTYRAQIRARQDCFGYTYKR